MGIDSSNTIKIKQQQEKDSPFLTLSERNKKGISSQNIFGGEEKAGQAQEPKRTERIAQLNIFGAEEGGQAKNDSSVFGGQEEKSCDTYFEENAQGEMNFNTNGFYDDALGLNFGNSSVSNPIAGSGEKAGSSNLKDLETELKLMLRNPEQNKTQINKLKAQIKAAGGNADKIIADNTQKAGSTQGVNNQAKAGAPQGANNQAKTGQATTNETTTATGIAGSTLNQYSNTDFYNNVDILTQKVDTSRQSGTTVTDVADSSSEGTGVMDAIKEGFSVQNIASQTASGVVSAGVESFVTEPAKEACKSIKESIFGKSDKDKGGTLDKDKASKADSVGEAENNVKRGQDASANARRDIETTGAEREDAQRGLVRSEAEIAAENASADANMQISAEQRTESDLQGKAAESAKMSKEASEVKEKECDAKVESLGEQISAIDTQIKQIKTDTGNSVTDAQNTAKKAELQAKKANLLMQQAKAKQEKALATKNKETQAAAEQEARYLAEKAKEAAAEAQDTADESRKMIKNKKIEKTQFKQIYLASGRAHNIANRTLGSANVFTEASQTRLNELKQFHEKYPNAKK